ncbi:hypothetical protein DL771_012436 [Monosporascus sp. 5C6A]|nr:hypothetical protein DL771_012436 [Monosporascus sp. 5C6A]
MKSDYHIDKIERWLSPPPNASTNTNHARILRLEGTGQCFSTAMPPASGASDHVNTCNYTDYQDVAKRFSKQGFFVSPPSVIGESNCVSLGKECIDADIRSYIISRLEESPEFQKWASFLSVLQQIRDEIGGRTDGMFRWAAYQLNNLEACLDREGYRSRSQIHPTRCKGKAICLVQFLVHAKRPLTLPEAGDVMTVRIDNHPRYFRAEDRMLRPTEIIQCLLLVLLVVVVVVMLA